MVALADMAELYCGRRYDTETGLYWYRTRYMDPVLGRFTSRDLIGVWGDLLNMGNALAYVGNFPLTLIDPFGLGAAEVAQGVLDFVRGAVDSATFGGTRIIREAIHGDNAEIINGSASTAGEVVETVGVTAAG